MSFFNPFRSTPGKTAAAVDPNASREGAGVPLELITYDPNTGKFQAGQQAMSVLRSVHGPVGVVAVCGRARQGKSFILNQLLGQSTGFVVAPTHRPCTKGLWMWSSPIQRKSADGSKYSLVLLDTEGIDAYDQTGQYSTQIFSLAVLLSSLFIYNQMGGIDEAALDRLSLVTEMTKHVRVRAGAAAGEGEAELREFNPAFLWLLRDFYLDLDEDGRKLTPREYLEIVLRPLKGTNASVSAKNKIRESIKNLFPNRDCYALIRPMTDESQLTKLDTIPPEKLRPQFVEDIKRLTRLIFTRAQPKRLGSQMISGAMLAGLAEAYVEAINKGAVPTIATAWQGVAEAECRRAADAAEAAYHAAFDKSAVHDETSMRGEHHRALSLAHKVYLEAAIGDESIRRANEKRFTDRVEAQFQQLWKERSISSESECRKLISEITARLTQAANKDGVTVADLQQQLAKWEQGYRSAPGTEGPSKWALHAEFMQSTFAEIVNTVIQRQQQATNSERLAAVRSLKEREQELQQEHAKAAQLEGQVAQLRRELEAERSNRQQAARKVAELEHQLQNLSVSQGEWANSKEQYSSEIQQLRQQLQQAAASASGKESSAAQQLSTVQAQLTKAEQELQRLREQKEAAHAQEAAAASELQHKSADLAALKARLDSASAQVSEANAARQQAEARLADLQRGMPSSPPPGNDEDGYNTPDEDKTAHLTPAKMTINDIKSWLTENGHENVVWDLTTQRAKKPRFVEEMNKVLGRTEG